MIKAIMGTTLIIGISDYNVDLMSKDRPIKIDLSKLIGKEEKIETIVIFHGRDDQHLYDQCKPMVDPMKTVIHSDQAPNN